MPASIADGGRYNAPGGAGSGDLYLGTWSPLAGDFYLSFLKWDDADATIAFSDSHFLTWTALTKRHHTAGGSNLRAQAAYIQNLATLGSDDVYAGPTSSVDNREAVNYVIRGVTAAPIVSTDNITYASGTSITAASFDPGANGGIVLGLFAWHETGLTPTIPAGWAAAPDIYSTASRTLVIYKVASGAGALAPSLSFSGSATVMGITIALAAPAGATPTFVTGYLEAAARGKTGLTVLAWPGDPSANLATKWTGIASANALDPDGNAAAKIVVSPAPGGTVDGQSLLMAVFDPASAEVSSYGFPAIVTGASSLIQTLDSPAETLTMAAYIAQMTTGNEIYFQHYPEDPGGVRFDVNGAAQTSNGVSFAFGFFISWGVIGPAPGGNLGPIDKLWIEIRKMHHGDYNGTTLTRQVAEDAPNGSIYDGDLASGAVTAVTRVLHPAGTGYGMRIRASECCVPGRYWHFYGAGASGPGSPANYTAYDRMVGGYQIRVSADTLADLAAQLPNLRMAAYAGGDFSTPRGGGPALTQIGNGMTRKIDDTWRWMLWCVKKGTTNVDIHPDSSGHISALAGDLSTLSGATLPTP